MIHVSSHLELFHQYPLAASRHCVRSCGSNDLNTMMLTKRSGSTNYSSAKRTRSIHFESWNSSFDFGLRATARNASDFGLRAAAGSASD
jgi:hypothetical protein